MGVDAKHPSWTLRAPDWDQMVDTYQGERHVKELGQKYLPATVGMEYDGMGEGQPGKAAYDAYVKRAVFPNDVRDAVDGLIGLMHRKPPKLIEVPKAMEPLLEKITADGADLLTLLRRINEQQLQKGRIGLLVEIPDNAGPTTLPYIATYDSVSIINWSSELDQEGRFMPVLVVLNETGNVLQPDLTWQVVEQYRVLSMSNFTPGAQLGPSDEEEQTGKGVYQVGVFRGAPTGGSGAGSKEFGALDQKEPSIGGRTMPKIPFIFVNTTDLAEDPAMPPLLGLSDKCVGIYRGEADYRQALFLQGQETLVIIGGDGGKDPTSEEDTRVGAGAVIELPAGAGVDAKYIGASAEGLSEMREALNSDYDKAAQMGMKLLDAGGEGTGSGQQSGEALRIRVAARTVSAVNIVRTGAAGLQLALQYIAEWMGLNPEDVKVDPNIDFADEVMEAKELAELMTAKQMGAPISIQTIHAIMEAREMTGLTFEEEMALIEEEDAMPGGAGLGAPEPPTPEEPPATEE